MSDEVKTTQLNRVYNFNPGPAVLPLSVLEQAQAEMMDYHGCGMSVMELSHRSKEFEEIIRTTDADLRDLLNIPANYKVLFLQGGASLQFAMVPMNLRPAGASADYIVTGSWSKAAIKDAKKMGLARAAANTEATNYNRIPTAAELEYDPQAAYLHYTSNETIHGVEWATEPVPPANVPLICDISSYFLSRPVDVTKYAMIYAGAQKNAGPAGVTMIILRDDMLERVPATLPVMLDYKLQAETGSMHNTPPCWSIYISGLVLQWLKKLGGLPVIAEMNTKKADVVYAAIDRSGGFYRGHAVPEARSKMNVTFRLPNEDLEALFVKESKKAGLVGLKGHRSVGGMRASLYNALALEGCQALAQFMDDFRQKNG